MKKAVRFVLLAVFAVLVMQSCGSNEKTTESGITYEIVREGNGVPPTDGEYVILSMKYGVGDSVWMDTRERMPVALQKDDSLWRNGGGIHEIFANMTPGDSVAFQISAEKLFSETWKRQLPPDLGPETQISFNICMDTVLTAQGYGAWSQKIIDQEQRKMEAVQMEQLERDLELIESYLEEKNIDAQKTESGLYYVITEEGAGEEANPLDTASVMYKGYLLSGEVFDTNIENVARENDLYREDRDYVPFDFVIGRSRVIRGWHEGIDLLSEGGKATLFVPSKLGYGPNAAGPTIPPNTVLLFDVELVDVKK